MGSPSSSGYSISGFALTWIAAVMVVETSRVESFSIHHTPLIIPGNAAHGQSKLGGYVRNRGASESIHQVEYSQRARRNAGSQRAAIGRASSGPRTAATRPT